ncbi:hypothetical protein ebD42 [Aromatoleum aromaticum EbN1]|uniref:DUF4124 domain-containing protein n=1 Tax=Aromatoleum aromaticum (strain DSM 19018 / LMG 30748 / EbN1) TaxID=76114 RepID=Q5P6D1_AROAE|nr:DUF4124 domain-containing protein [Aromatoleum aromaticum]CAI07130.1 hypothetical protein ebD42 [Aromatoleum aromaticum EbN1]
MKRIGLLAVLAASILPVQAQVYKCPEGGRVVFSDRPCHADAAPLDVKPASGDYNYLDDMQAQNRTLNKKIELMKIEGEREENRRAGMIESERRKKAESDRCKQIREDKADAEHLAKTFIYEENILREEEKARKLAEREFFDCQ